MDKTNKETTAEEARQNWHITEMQHNWATRRKMAKKIATDNIAKAKEEKNRAMRLINEKYEAEKRMFQDRCDRAVAEIESQLNDELLSVARDQDEYMHRFRNYVASLTKDEQQAYNTREERE